MSTLIYGGTIINEGRAFEGSIEIDNDRIIAVMENVKTPRGHYDKCVDATGCFVLPGIIDDHVHFREPGLTSKADIESESRAAAYGGVTSDFEMPFPFANLAISPSSFSFHSPSFLNSGKR